MSQPDGYLNLTQAAAAVGITRKTLYQHIGKGLISVTRKQNKRFIHVTELERHYGSVTIPQPKLNEPIRKQSNQTEGNDIATLTATVQRLERETQQLRAGVQEAQKTAQDAIQELSEYVRLIMPPQPREPLPPLPEEPEVKRSWWRKFWD